MQRPLLCLALLPLLVHGVTAQSFDTSPPDLLTKEGPGVADGFGTYPASRLMLFDGELQGKAGAINEVALRGNDQSYTALNGMGRSWSNVTLDVADCDMAKLTNTYSQNPTSTPSRVFSGGIAFPTRTGAPLVRPDLFGSVTGHMKFPFTSAWVYSGTQSICLDFDFTGGTLANSAPWSGAQNIAYSLDGYVVGATSASGQESVYGKSLQQGGCQDTGANFGFGAYVSVSATTYSLSAPQNPGQIVFRVTSLFTAPNKPVIHAYNISGSVNGNPFPGVACNQLFVALDPLTLFMTRIAPGPSTYALVNYDVVVPFDVRLKGVPVWMQGAFSDSKSGSLLLTNASRNIVADIPRSVLRRTLYSSTSRATLGTGPTDGADWNPVLRYGR
jgi:hypothetical protein